MCTPLKEKRDKQTGWGGDYTSILRGKKGGGISNAAGGRPFRDGSFERAA